MAMWLRQARGAETYAEMHAISEWKQSMENAQGCFSAQPSMLADGKGQKEQQMKTHTSCLNETAGAVWRVRD